MSIKFHLFGAFRVTVAEQPVTGFRSDKARALLAYLAVEGKTPVRRSALMQLLWSGYAAPSASASLRTVLSNLNQLFKEHNLLHINYHTVQFTGKAPVCELDVDQAEALLARAAATLSAHEQTVLHRQLGQPFLQGMEEIDSPPFVAWLQARRAHYQRAQSSHPVLYAPAPLANLPAPVNRLIGRADDLAAAAALLAAAHVRLLTLVGPPGVGKSRLALALADQAQPTFAQGVCFVPLAAVAEPEQVVLVICQALGLQLTGSPPVLEQLISYLRSQQLLLLLDNFEQVVAAGPLLMRLLNAAPQVKVLVTSRVALHLSGEWQYVVTPLATTTTTASTTLEAAPPAAVLFVERAQAVRPSFALTAATQAAVTELCQRLDGLPLAIELAAARSRIFSPQAMLERISDSAPAALQLLSYGAHDLPERHRTLLAAIQWSYLLLAPNEQQLLAHLGTFVGGFTLAAASALCGATAERLETLLSHSLLQQRDQPDGSPRFFLLETVRFFALAQLDEQTTAILRQQHATYFAHWVQTQVEPLHGPRQLAAVEEVRQEQENWWTALTWAADHALPLALSLATNLGRFWRLAETPLAGYNWLQRLTSVGGRGVELPPVLYAYARLAEFDLAQLCGQPLTPYLAEQPQLAAIFNSAADQRGLGRLYWLVGRALLEHPYQPEDGTVGKRYASAGVALQQAHTLLQAADDPVYLAYVLYDLSKFHILVGRFPESRVCLQTALPLGQARGDALLVAQLTTNLALASYIFGDFRAAIAHCEASLPIFQRVRSLHNWALTLAILALSLVEQGEPVYAQRALEAGQALVKQAPDHMIEGFLLYATALLAEHQGRLAEALQLYGQGLAMTVLTGSVAAFAIFFTLCELLVTLQADEVARDGLQIFQSWLVSVGGLPDHWQRQWEQMRGVLQERLGPTAFASTALPANAAEMNATVAAWLGRVLAYPGA